MQKVVAGFIGVTIVVVAIAAGLLLVQKPVAKQPEPTKQESKIMDTGSLQIKDNVVGTGAEAVDGKKVSVHYTGTLTDGTKFDSSVDRGTPFEFTLGAGQVIAGWDQGVKSMKVGGKRNLIIPASLGYGDRSAGTIPANSTLVFDVELLAVN